ncbi:39S ribosomal protein L18, mitochondrial [Photinus pyralis]|uniref:Large ribosomal subunit protein uL18m n=1 Tax=Photinus pyralis TaxID=7054 RepID=A0A1Y1JR83_PHOPY|nr:39S ribosomal protein L18, mitochondrial [Photinus pyralis]
MYRYRSLKFALNSRFASTLPSENDSINPIFTNRNPRSLEYLRIANKPDGYYVDKPGRSYWHKLQLTQTGRHVTASLVHHINGPVLVASTKEWAIKKQLYKTTDSSAYMNVARVFAQRCLESGLIEFMCDLESEHNNSKIAKFLNVLQDFGLKLSEPEQYKTILPWTRERPPKPWDITE